MKEKHKGLFSRALSIALSVLLAFGIIATGGTQANAEGVKYKLQVQGPVYDGQYVWLDVTYDDGSFADTKLLSVKSSNSKVIKVKKYVSKEGGEVYRYFDLTAKKAGKTTLTVRFKDSDGNTRTLKKNVTVKKYPKMLKSVKINGKSLKLSSHKFDYMKRNYKKSSVKIKVVPSKGWKVVNVTGLTYNAKKENFKETKIKGIKKAIKNGSTIKFPKKNTNLYVGVELKKGKTTLFYDINILR